MVSRLPVVRRSAQVFVEPVQRALPGLLCRGFVVTGCRIVVETVIGAFIDVSLVRHLGLRERGVERWPSVGDPRVELTVLRIDRRLDFYGIGDARLSSVCAER